MIGCVETRSPERGVASNVKKAETRLVTMRSQHNYTEVVLSVVVVNYGQ